MQKQELVRRGRVRIFAAAGCAALAISGSFAPAGSLTWDNSSGDGKWFTNTNWDRDLVPTSSDTATFPAGSSGGSSTVDLEGSSPAEASFLYVHDNYDFVNGSFNMGFGGIYVSDGATARFDTLLLPTSSQGLVKNDLGTLVLTTAGSAPFQVTVNEGTLRVESAGIIGPAIMGGGKLELGGITLDEDVDMRSGGEIGGTETSSLTGTIFTDSGSMVFSSTGTLTIGAIHDFSTTIRKTTHIAGAGVIELTQPTTINTQWTIDGGTLQVSDNSQLGKATNPIQVNGGTFSVAGALTANRPVSIGSTGGTINLAAGAALTLTAPLSGTLSSSSELDINGPGQLTLTKPSTFQGTTWIGKGATVRLQDASAVGAPGSGSGIVLAGATLELDNVSLTTQFPSVGVIGSGHDVIRGTGASASVRLQHLFNIPVPIETAMRLETGDDPSDTLAVTYSNGQQTTDTSLFTVAGAGTVTPTNFAYTGLWSVESGTLRVTDPNALGANYAVTPTVNVAAGAKLFIDNTDLGRSIELNDNTSLLGANGLMEGYVTAADHANVALTADSAGSLTLSREVLGGTGSTIHVEGAGQVILATPSGYPASTYAGDWSLDGGTLQIDSAKQLGADAGKLIFNGGLFRSHNGGWISHRELVVNAAGGTIDTGQYGADFLGLVSGPGTLTKAGTANLYLRSSVDIGGLNISEGTTWLGGRVGSLTISDTAKLNLSAAMTVTGDTVGSWNGSAYTDLSGMVQRGRNGGTWSGAGGIVTSDSRAASGLCAIGIASASQVLGIDSTATGTWHGQTVTGTDSLIAFTYGGDANLDGKINIDDYGRIDSNVGQSGSVFGWYNGDFNYDGKINIDDYGIIDSNIGAQGAPLGGASQSLGATGESLDVTAVPEPASMGLLLAGSLLLTRRRRGSTIC